MGKRKAELEHYRVEYRALMAKARSAERQGLYRRAVEFALASFPHIDKMMQYERTYEEKEFASIEGVDMILKYAPLLLDFASLDTLESLLKKCRRIEKNTSQSLADKLAKARALMWDAHRLWDHVERNPEARQDELRRVLGGDQDKWRTLAHAWENMGLVRRTPEGSSYRLAISTRMAEVVSGKCPCCGSVSAAPKAMLLEQSRCPKCQENVLFVMVTGESATATKE